MAVRDTDIGQIYTHSIDMESKVETPDEVKGFSDLGFLFGENGEKFISRMEVVEAKLLFDIACELEGDVLDIGTRHGGSAFIIVSALKSGTVKSIDISPALHPAVRDMIDRTSVTNRVEFILGNSRDGFKDNLFSMIVFDGDHSTHGVCLDVLANWSSLKNGEGIALFHDVDLEGLGGQKYDPEASQTDFQRCITPVVRALIAEGAAEFFRGAGELCALRKTASIPSDFIEKWGFQLPENLARDSEQVNKTVVLRTPGEALSEIGMRASTLAWVNGTLEVERDCSISSSHFYNECSIGTMTYFGPGCSVRNTDFGRYCAIASGVSCGSDGHPTDWLSIHPFQYRGTGHFAHSKFYEQISENPSKYLGNRKQTTVGSDVWIGERAWIKKGVKIGNGAIVDSHAVVVDDVPNFAIVSGVPAKVIRYRFDEGLREQLEDLKWWDLDISPVAAHCDFSDPHRAVSILKNTALRKLSVPRYRIVRRSPQELSATEI